MFCREVPTDCPALHGSSSRAGWRLQLAVAPPGDDDLPPLAQHRLLTVLTARRQATTCHRQTSATSLDSPDGATPSPWTEQPAASCRHAFRRRQDRDGPP